MELLLVRHADVTSDAHGRCYGRLEFALSDAGREQARGLAARLARAEIAAVVSSPRVRAYDTAIPIAEMHGLTISTLDELRELDFGEFEGLRYNEIAEAWPELYERWMRAPTTVEFPGGERFVDLQARAADVVARLRAEYEGRIVVAVTHAGLVRTVVAAALGMPDERIFRLSVDTASITHVCWSRDAALVRSVNAT